MTWLNKQWHTGCDIILVIIGTHEFCHSYCQDTMKIKFNSTLYSFICNRICKSYGGLLSLFLFTLEYSATVFQLLHVSFIDFENDADHWVVHSLWSVLMSVYHCISHPYDQNLWEASPNKDNYLWGLVYCLFPL